MKSCPTISSDEKPKIFSAAGFTRVTLRLRPMSERTTSAAARHSLFQARGGEHGRDVEDWFVAEAELLDGRRDRLDLPPRLSDGSVGTLRVTCGQEKPRILSEGIGDADPVRAELG